MMNILAGFLLMITLSSCIHHSESENVLQKFDSVDQSLHRVNSKIEENTKALYDSIGEKYDESHLRQFRDIIADCKSYLDELKRRFNIYCGDSTGTQLPENSLDDISLTNRYFSDEHGFGRHVVPMFEHVQRVALANTSDPALEGRIRNLTALPASQKESSFMKLYFYNVPPVAVMTILSKFANDISIIENKILQEHLNK